MSKKNYDPINTLKQLRQITLVLAGIEIQVKHLVHEIRKNPSHQDHGTEFLCRKEAASFLGISLRHFDRKVADNKIPKHYNTNGRPLFKKDDLMLSGKRLESKWMKDLLRK